MEAMKLTSTVTYNASPEEVINALLSEELSQVRAESLGLTDIKHVRNGLTATTEVTVPAEKLPSKVRNFAKNGVRATIATQANGTVVTYKVDPHGLPVEVKASINMSGDTTTTADFTGELKVKIPLLGSSIEKRAASFLDRFLAQDAALVEKIVSSS